MKERVDIHSLLKSIPYRRSSWQPELHERREKRQTQKKRKKLRETKRLDMNGWQSITTVRTSRWINCRERGAASSFNRHRNIWLSNRAEDFLSVLAHLHVVLCEGVLVYATREVTSPGRNAAPPCIHLSLFLVRSCIDIFFLLISLIPTFSTTSLYFIYLTNFDRAT